MSRRAVSRRELWLAIGENVKIALDAIRANKLRSVLTVLGNVVAVMSVIAVVAIIDGMNTYVSEKILEQGLQVITIDKFGLITDDKEWEDAQKRRDLTSLDAEALSARMRLASHVVAQTEANHRVRAGRVELANVRVLGTTENYDETSKFELDQGRHLDQADVERRRPVCVVGSEVAEALFPRLDPIGRSIKVSGHDLRVVGTLQSRGNVLGQSQDNVVVLPLGQFQKMYGSRRSLTILVKSSPGADLDRVMDEARVILRAQRHVPLGTPDDFAISTAETFQALYKSLTGGIFAGTIALVAISLLVGGIVIMNIMLVAVTERTREIGIRKALGARRADLVGQFLSEAVVLSLFGGVLGIAFGIAVALAIRAATPLPATIQPWSVAISLGVASSVGLFFGVYPATRAARLDPIVALSRSGMAIEVGEGITIALGAIRTNKLRSFLTVLGVIIGITTIMAMVSIIEGLNRSMKAQLASIGTDVLYIRPFAPGAWFGGFPDSLRRRPWFTVEDAEAIRAHCDAVLAVAPLNFTQAPLRYRETETRPAFVIGTSPDFLVTNNYAVSAGRFFTDSELEHRAPVVVLGLDQVETLFPHGQAPGKSISIGGRPFTVIGELDKRGKFIGQSLDDAVLVPHTTLEKNFGPRLPMVLNAKPVTTEEIEVARDQIGDVMRRQRKLRYSQGDNFAVFTDQSIVDLYNQITGAFYLVMVVISSIGLMVGGIGVMNIMLVSVTERTREIGLRKALGARQRDILWQFLVEAMTLTGAGGIIGVAVGLLAGWLVDIATPLSFAIPPWGIALGFFSATSIGLFFGMYPAAKAARLDPVEALRYQ